MRRTPLYLLEAARETFVGTRPKLRSVTRAKIEKEISKLGGDGEGTGGGRFGFLTQRQKTAAAASGKARGATAKRAREVVLAVMDKLGVDRLQMASATVETRMIGSRVNKSAKVYFHQDKPMLATWGTSTAARVVPLSPSLDGVAGLSVKRAKSYYFVWPTGK